MFIPDTIHFLSLSACCEILQTWINGCKTFSEILVFVITGLAAGSQTSL
jgi:hypothetical protein